MKQLVRSILLILLSGCSLFRSTQEIIIEWPQACFNDTCFSIEVADSHEERMQWLMHRTQMAHDAWMLFIFESSAPMRKFWMKNTLLPLDMVWLDESATIVHIEEDVPPCEADPCSNYGPEQTVSRYVLELNAWLVAELGSEKGDEVTITLVDSN